MNDPMIRYAASLIVVTLLCCSQVWGADYRKYLDATHGSDVSTGDSAETPYKNLSAINWNACGNAVSGGGVCIINLKRGEVWRATSAATPLAVAASGAAGRPITIQSYGTGAAGPGIYGSGILTGFTPVRGQKSTYAVPLITRPKLAWINGVMAHRGENATDDGLGEGDWYWSDGVLYLRSDTGNPDALGWVVEGALANHTIEIAGHGHVTIKDLRIERANDHLFRQSNPRGDDVVLDGLFLGNSWDGLDISGKITLRNSRVSKLYHTTAAALTTGSPAAALTLANCLIDQIYGSFGGIRINRATGSHSINTTTFAGIAGPAVTNNSSSTITIRNCIFAGVGYTARVLRNTGAGVINLSHGLVSGISYHTATSYYENTGAGSFPLPTDMHFGDPFFLTLNPVLVSITNDDSNIMTARQALDAIRSFNNRNWTGATSFLIASAAPDWKEVAEFVDNGGEVGCHTTNGTDISAVNVIQLCAGSAVINPAYSVVGSVMTLYNNGGAERVIDLSATTNKTLGSRKNSLLSSLDGLANWNARITSTCATPFCANHLSVSLAEALKVPIAACPGYTDIPLSSSRVLANEVAACIAEYAAHIPGYASRKNWTFAYSGGSYHVDIDASAYMNSTGVIASRTVTGYTPVTGLDLTEDLWLHRTKAATSDSKSFAGSGTLALWQYDSGRVETDSTHQGNTLLTSGTVTTQRVTSASIKGNQSSRSSGVFDGKSYQYRTQAFSHGGYTDIDGASPDWLWGGYFYPTALPVKGTKATLLWHSSGSDDRNYHWLYLRDDGHVEYLLRVAGTTAVTLTSSNTVTANCAYTIVVEHHQGMIRLYVNSGTTFTTEVASAALATAPVAAERFQIGASWLNGTAGNFYTGHADNVFLARQSFRIGLAYAIGSAILSQPLTIYFHNSLDSNILKTMLKGMAAYRSSPVQIRPYGEIFAWLRDNGAVSHNGQRLRYVFPTSNDYRITRESAANVKGDGVDYLGWQGGIATTPRLFALDIHDKIP